MIAKFSATAAWALFGLCACGATRVSKQSVEQPEEPKAVEQPKESKLPAALCPSAAWPDRSAPVAAAFDGLDLVALDGTGARRVLNSFAGPANVSGAATGKQILVEPGRMTAIVAWSFEDEATGERVGASGESMRLDASGGFIWRLPGSISAPSDAGAVSQIDGGWFLARSDGRLSPLPSPVAGWTKRMFMATEGIRDWIFVRGTVASDATSEKTSIGLVNLDGKGFIELPARGNGPLNLREVAGKFVYMSADATWAITFAGPNGSHTIDLSIPFAGYRTPEIAGWEPQAVIVYDGRPVFGVDVVAETLTPISTAVTDAALEARRGYGPPTTYASGKWVLGAIDGDPVWLANAETASVEAVSVARQSPLRRLDAMYCGSVSFPHEGLVGLGLRDDHTAGFYVGRAGGTDWTRIGRPYRDVIGITGFRVADTWIINSQSGENTYCPTFSPFDAPYDPEIIVGDATQIVTPSGPPIVSQSEPTWVDAALELDPTGMCAHRTPSDGITAPDLYDLVTRGSFALEGLEDFEWLAP